MLNTIVILLAICLGYVVMGKMAVGNREQRRHWNSFAICMMTIVVVLLPTSLVADWLKLCVGCGAIVLLTRLEKSK